MRVVIVDDEYYALQGLRMELEDIGGIKISGMYETGAEMLDEIKETRPDIIFMDIEMPQMSGFDIFEKLMDEGCAPNIVFVTAYSQYAVKAFEINAIDYIIKPVTKSRLLKTLERIRPVSSAEKNTTIQIKCFRHFSILADGREINSGWRTRKAEELIAFLVSEKGKFVSKDRIAETLWPGQARESAMSNLYMAYYYIKKQEDKTGAVIPIESERGKMRVNTDLIECDILEFDRLIEVGTLAGGNEKAICMEEATCMEKAALLEKAAFLERAACMERIAHLERAVGLYQGLPFEDSYYHWADSIQGYYEFRYLELLSELISYCRKNADEKKAGFYQEIFRNANII